MKMRNFNGHLRFVYSIVILLFGLEPLASAAVTPGEPSFAEQGDRALHAGDYPTAIELYEHWLEADPGDFLHWYNYACALSMMDKHEEALRALEGAVKTGFKECDWAERDPDLAGLKKFPEFAVILDRMKSLENSESNLVGNTHTGYQLQKRLAPYRLITPGKSSIPETGSPVIILLHSRTHDMEEMEDLTLRLALPGVIYILPRAPYAISGNVQGFEYWPGEQSNPCDSAMQETITEQYSGWLKDILFSIEKQNKVDTARVYIGGYGEGAEMALLAAAEYPELFRGCFLIAGMVDSTRLENISFASKKMNELQYYIGYGSRDRILSFSAIRQIRNIRQELDLSMKIHEFPFGHGLQDEIVYDVANWLLETGVRRP